METICMILGIAAVIVATASLIREEELRRLLKEANSQISVLQKEFDDLPEEDYYEMIDPDYDEDTCEDTDGETEIPEDEPEEGSEEEFFDTEGEELYEDEEFSGEAEESGYEEEICGEDDASEDIAEENDEGSEETADEFEVSAEEETESEEESAVPEEEAVEETFEEPDTDFEEQVALIQQEFERQESEVAESDDEPEAENSAPENEEDDLEKEYFGSYIAPAEDANDEDGPVEMVAGVREISDDISSRIYDGVPAGNSEVDYIVNRLRIQLDTDSFMDVESEEPDEPDELVLDIPAEYDDDDVDEELEVTEEMLPDETPEAEPEKQPVRTGEEAFEHDLYEVGNEWLGASQNHRSVIRKMTVRDAPFVMDECIFAGFRGYNTAELTFRNITKKVMISLTLDILCDDPSGTTTPAIENYEYKDLTVKPGRQFGFGTAIELPKWTVGITPVVKYIAFSDDTYWESNDTDWIPSQV